MKMKSFMNKSERQVYWEAFDRARASIPQPDWREALRLAGVALRNHKAMALVLAREKRAAARKEKRAKCA